jgi:hypothetical protein
MSEQDVYAIHLDFQCVGMPNPGSVNMHYFVDDANGGLTAAQEVQDLTEAFDVATQDLFRALIPTTGTYIGVRGRGWSTPDVGFDVSIQAAGTRDLAGASEQPAQVARVVAKKSLFIGRKNSGRMYLPPVGEVDYTGNNTWASAYTTDIQDWLTAIITPIVGDSTSVYRLVILSTKFSSSQFVVSMPIRNIPGTIRRRLR